MTNVPPDHSPAPEPLQSAAAPEQRQSYAEPAAPEPAGYVPAPGPAQPAPSPYGAPGGEVQQATQPMSQPQPAPAQPEQPQWQAQPTQGGGPATYAVYVNQPAATYVKPEPRGFSVTAMVLGLVSIVFGFTVILPLAALILGIIGLRKEPTGKGMAIVGIIVGGLDLLFWLLLGGAIFAAIAATIGLGGAAVSGG